ncbi:hypothetical protein Rhopal_000980-T1 [Rhodotorula paludigena]|uniref:TPR-like protein n=1 Tax=Rhodotorula paludigena TaxID=86838 RepID=A0AAV5GF90_9BASI|nr:hypothetical protein Rhopal_000980-T1 [Rhodotorula paludigena]
MSFGALAAIVKTLYEYHCVHSRNKALLDILEGFSQNLEISLDRLQAREEMLGFGKNEALESISRDFSNAKTWLETNDKNLRSVWTALQACDKLADLDARLTKAFASKMATAIFAALQDTRAGVAKLQTTMDGLPSNLETVCSTSTKEAIHEAITELKKEAYEVVGGSEGRDRGFRNGEAEKIISQLVDQLAEQERIKEDEELLATAGYAPLVPSGSGTNPPPVPRISSYGAPSSVISSAVSNDPFDPAPSRGTSLFSRRPSSATLATSFIESDIGASRTATQSADEAASTQSGRSRAAKKGKEKSTLPPGAVVLNSKDPFTDQDLIDPVLANDGLIHDRWCLVSKEYRQQNLRDPGEPLIIVGDVVQLREALFVAFPERRTDFQERRQAYRRETLDLYESASYANLPDLVNRLSHILLFEPTSVSLRVRRGMCYYRLRFLDEALADLDAAVDLSKRSVDGEPEKHEPDIDALRARALILEERHENALAMRDIDLVLESTPNDVLALSLRAILRGSAGDLTAAQADLAATNAAVRSGKAYRSRLGDADCDLEYLARGWAYCSVGDFASAAADFGFSAGLRDPSEPYTLACRALAQIKEQEAAGTVSLDTLTEALATLDSCLEVLKSAVAKEEDVAASYGRYTSGAPFLTVGEDGLPAAAYPLLLLRASARTTQGELELALHDYDLALRLRPACVKDVATVRVALAELRAACGDRDGAQRDFDLALAVCEKGQRAAILSVRDEHGL